MTELIQGEIRLENGQWAVYVKSEESVYPATSYSSPAKALARLAQMFGEKVVYAQTWPERICIEVNPDE